MDKERTKKLLKIAKERMFTALEAFFLWKKLNQMMNINEVGQKEAERNVEIMKKHWDFFHPVLISTYKSFITDLFIFFDAGRNTDSFSLDKLTREIIKIDMVDETSLKEKIDEIKKSRGITISFIGKLRNTEVSHQSIEKNKNVIIYKEIEDLFIGVQEILNLLSGYYDDSCTLWDHIGEDVSNGATFVIDNLERGEKSRIDEIYKEYVAKNESQDFVPKGN